MENTGTIYDLVFSGYTPGSAALAIFPVVNLAVWALSSILFRAYRGSIPLPVQILLFASLMGTGTIAYLDIYGYTAKNLVIAGATSMALLLATALSMASWRKAPREEIWSMKRRPLTLGIRMLTIAPMSLAWAMPVIASYYALEATAIMDRGMSETSMQIRRDANTREGFMSKEMVARADKTITWYQADEKGWQRDIWRIGSLDLGRIIWNARNVEAAIPSDLSFDIWQIAQIGFTYGEEAASIGFPIVCEYRNGTFDRARFLLGGPDDISVDTGLDHIGALCPDAFNPENAPLSDPANIFPEPAVKAKPKGEIT